MRGVQAISRKDRPRGKLAQSSEVLPERNPQRLHARRPAQYVSREAKIKSELHGDMQRVAEMTTPGPHPPDSRVRPVPSNNVSEIPCRVSSDLHEWSNDLGTVSTRGSANL